MTIRNRLGISKLTTYSRGRLRITTWGGEEKSEPILSVTWKQWSLGFLVSFKMQRPVEKEHWEMWGLLLATHLTGAGWAGARDCYIGQRQMWPKLLWIHNQLEFSPHKPGTFLKLATSYSYISPHDPFASGLCRFRQKLKSPNTKSGCFCCICDPSNETNPPTASLPFILVTSMQTFLLQNL